MYVHDAPCEASGTFKTWRRSVVPMTVVAALVLGFSLATAKGAARVALVIGNGAYTHTASLRNPPNDAEAISAALKRLGFIVIRLDDAGQAAMRQGLQVFARAATGVEIALVFYTGHGMEVDKHNFLVPVDARLASDQDVEFEAVPLDLVMRAVGRASGPGLVILDACRNNPFVAAMQRSGSTRAIGRGLGRVEPLGETLVAYAAKEGTQAADGEGRNSPYTEVLLRYLEEPGLEIGLLFRKVRDAVVASTGGRQEPFVYGSLSSEGMYLRAAEPASPVASVPRPVADNGETGRVRAERLATEREFWQSIKGSTNRSDFMAYLEQYRGGAYETLARNRLKHLEGSAGVDSAALSQEESASVPALSLPRPELVEASLGLSRLERRLIQLGLAAEGFDPGPADGVIGRGTRQAISRWQAFRGAASTGYLDAESSKLLLTERQAEEKDQTLQQARSEEETRKWNQPQRLNNLLAMVRVQGGAFTMGCERGRDWNCDGEEKPAHRVQVGSFEIGKYEATQELWEAVMGDNPSHFEGCTRCPVENVSWDDAQAFLRKLSDQTGEGYRLPTQAEWEYAARGGQQSRGYEYAGSNDLGSIAWYLHNSVNKTHPVGRKQPNELGLYDMSGNVSEWVQDCWRDSYAGVPDDGRAWASEGNCGKRVLRGGSWVSGPGLLSAAFRLRSSSDPVSSRGFRVSRTLTP